MPSRHESSVDINESRQAIALLAISDPFISKGAAGKRLLSRWLKVDKSGNKQQESGIYQAI